MDGRGTGLAVSHALIIADGDVEIMGGPPFIGMVGLHRVHPYPFAPAVEIGWRLDPAHWSQGCAAETAEASLCHGFASGLEEIVALAAATNLRSQAVMRHIGLTRDPDADFVHPGLPADGPLLHHVLYRAGPLSQRAHKVGA